MNKRGMEFGFAWIFALIAGGAILFLAIFAVSQLIKTSEREVNTKVAVEFTNVLDPLQTTVSESSGNKINLPVEARIFNSCNLEGVFGNSIVSFSERIGFGDEWTKPGLESKTKSAYLFSENKLEGKEVSFLVFPFKMPFKVGDILIAYTDNYCFVNTPLEVEIKLKDLLTKNNQLIVFSNSLSSCPDNARTVCFEGNCDVTVECEDYDCNNGFVKKENELLYFSDNLLYAAIFSSKENYKCNINRLVKRLAIVSDIYSKKSQFVSSRGCININLREDILNLNENSLNYEELSDLREIEIISTELNNKNEDLECQLF